MHRPDQRRGARTSTALPAELAALLGPALPGAACSGRSTLFDPPHPGEDPDELAYRHRAARTICATCPALPACRGAAPAFTDQHGAGAEGFVLAGHTLTTRTNSSSGSRCAPITSGDTERRSA